MVCGRFIILFQWRLIDFDALRLDNISDLNLPVSKQGRQEVGVRNTNSVFEAGKVCRAERVGFGNDGDQVDPGAQSFHDLNIQGFERVASRSYEIQAGVYTKIYLVDPARLLFLQHVRFMLIIQEFNDRHP